MKVSVVKINKPGAEYKNAEFKPSPTWAEITCEIPGRGLMHMYFSPEGQKVAESEDGTRF